VQDPETLEQRYRPWFGSDDILGMVGTDHMPLVRDLPADAHVGTLAEYLAARLGRRAVRRGGGDALRGAREPPAGRRLGADRPQGGVLAAERWLERYAEPLQTLYGDDDAEPFLREAWKRMFQNAAHDSICGCSADEVSAQVLVRYAEAEQIARELTHAPCGGSRHRSARRVRRW
jgi:hypothetical protein